MTGDASPTKAFRYQETLVSTIPAAAQNVSYVRAGFPPLLKGLKTFFAYKYFSLFALDKLPETCARAHAPIVASFKGEWGHVLLEFLILTGEKCSTLGSLKNAGMSQS